MDEKGHREDVGYHYIRVMDQMNDVSQAAFQAASWMVLDDGIVLGTIDELQEAWANLKPRMDGLLIALDQWQLHADGAPEAPTGYEHFPAPEEV